MDLPRGTTPSPNIWEFPEIYERENRAVDPDGVLDAVLAEIVGTGSDGGWGTVLEIGCGAGFHLPRLAARATTMIGVEPHPQVALRAADRIRPLPNVTVRHGVAQSLPVPDRSIDVAHARWAYFFGPGCEPGLTELARVCRRGGVALIADHDATRSSVGRWFTEGLRVDGLRYDSAEVERFWARQGFTRRRVDVRWVFQSAEALAEVLRIEFPRSVADAAVAEVARRATGWDVDAAVNLWHRRY